MQNKQMKKDLYIAPVENVFLAITTEYNELFQGDDYYVYLINQKDVDLEMVLILSSGTDGSRKTSKMHHKIQMLPAKSVAKVELLQEDVLALDNHFKVTFFENNRMFEKDFVIEKNAFKEGQIQHIEFLNKKGLLIK